MSFPITRKFLEARLEIVKAECQLPALSLDYNQYYGYRLESDSGLRAFTERLPGRAMLAFMDGMLFASRQPGPKS